jgi:hypothetical protein
MRAAARKQAQADEATMSLFSEWDNYYVIIGSSAAALTGLQFVVIALVAEANARSTTREVDAFATPTIVHFGTVLLVSGILTAPWHGLTLPAVLLGGSGLAGVVYAILIIRRARRQPYYRPVLEDWLFHAAFPFVAYAVLAAGAFALPLYPRRALFAIGATALLLLFIGIHNAWDAVTYIAIAQRQDSGEPRPPASDRP